MFSEKEAITEASCVGASCDKTIGVICDISQISPLNIAQCCNNFPHTVTTCPCDIAPYNNNLSQLFC